MTGVPAPEPQANPSSPHVRFVAADGIRVLRFEDESVVFNPISWDAHLLNAAAVAVLEELAQGPRSVGEVELFLSEALFEAERTEAAAHTQRLLHEFEELGLAYRLKENAFAGG